MAIRFRFHRLMTSSLLVQIILACLLGGVLSIGAAALILFGLPRRWITLTISFSTGLLLAMALLHLLPEALEQGLTPHEALSTMFAKLRAKFDPRLLQVFVRCLGVYPPGTIVQLSNGVIGMVATINTARPMKPMVVVYDAQIPKEEAILVNMDGEVDVNIAKAIRPSQLPREIYTYLSPRKQVSYYFDAGAPNKENATS